MTGALAEVGRSPAPRGGIAAPDRALTGAAVAALLAELHAYPKPGLVSPVDSGAHRDMDFALMRRSARALRRPLARIAAAGRDGRSFAAGLVPLGLEAERAMLRATGGVNTHRGAIFTLGLLVAAIARAVALEIPPRPAAVRAVLRREWGGALAAHAAAGERAASHGGLVRRRTGVTGARGEAARGFPAIFEVGLPAYERALADGLATNAARVHTLFVLMGAVEDSNVLFRGGADGGRYVRAAAAAFLAAGGCGRAGWRARAEALHHDFVRRNLSPGGCADLLAGTLLLAAVEPA